MVELIKIESLLEQLTAKDKLILEIDQEREQIIKALIDVNNDLNKKEQEIISLKAELSEVIDENSNLVNANETMAREVLEYRDRLRVKNA